MSLATRGIAALIVVSTLAYGPCKRAADVVANYNPLAEGLLSDIPLETRWVQYGAAASPLTVVNMGPTAYVNDFAFPVGVTTTNLEIDLESYLTFTIEGNVAYESVQYDVRSYGSGPFTAAIRSDGDGFGANLDLVTELEVNSFDSPEGFHSYTFDVSSLGAQDGPVEFRIYHWDSLDEFGEGGGFQDIASSWNEGASGLTVRGLVDAPPTPEGIIANFNPTGPNDSSIPLPAAIEADGVNVSDLTNVGFEGGSWNNPHSVYPVVPTSPFPTIDLVRTSVSRSTETRRTKQFSSTPSATATVPTNRPFDRVRTTLPPTWIRLAAYLSTATTNLKVSTATISIFRRSGARRFGRVQDLPLGQSR